MRDVAVMMLVMTGPAAFLCCFLLLAFIAMGNRRAVLKEVAPPLANLAKLLFVFIPVAIAALDSGPIIASLSKSATAIAAAFSPQARYAASVCDRAGADARSCGPSSDPANPVEARGAPPASIPLASVPSMPAGCCNPRVQMPVGFQAFLLSGANGSDFLLICRMSAPNVIDCGSMPVQHAKLTRRVRRHLDALARR